MVNEKKKRVLHSFLKNLLKPASFFSCALLIAILCYQVILDKKTPVKYLDKYGFTHTITMPAKDKKKLTALMQKLFAENSFAYTILGSKPISWESYQDHLPLSSWTLFYNSFSKHNRVIRAGWKTWQKYQNLFPEVSLWAENSKRHLGSISILVVNEVSFNDVVNKYRRDFQDVLSREIVDGFQLIMESKNSSLIDEVLKGHQALIGIVLGYGRDNSWQFHEACKNRVPMSWVWENEESFFGEKAMPSDITLSDYYLSLYSCPSFAGDPNSAESLSLKKEYAETKQKVINYYKGKDFLEATLSLLAGYTPTN